MASDNLMAGIAGAASGVRDIFSEYFKSLLRQREQEKQDYMMGSDLPDSLSKEFGIPADKRFRKEALTPMTYGMAQPTYGWLQDGTWGVVGMGSRGSKVAPTPPTQSGTLFATKEQIESAAKTGKPIIAPRGVDVKPVPTDAENTKSEQKVTAQKRVTGNLETLSGLYESLRDRGAIVDPGRGIIPNISSRISSSKIGQTVEGAMGTTDQSIRNQINQIRPLLIQDIRQATQMGARGLDSEKELEFYLQAATDPSRDIESNLNALKVLDRAYGLGNLRTKTGIKSSTGTQVPVLPKSSAIPIVGGKYDGKTVTRVRRVR